MADGEVIIEVGDDDFERAVLARSRTVPVVVDFWAPWCGPCRTLGPVLERLAREHGGAFVLAKVNIDTAPATAEGFRIQSIPAVKAFRDGALVSEFVGAQPEHAVRQFLAGILPTEADQLAATGERCAADGDGAGARSAFEAAIAQDGHQAYALLGLARLDAAAGDVARALEHLARISPGVPVAADAERLAAELRTRVDGGGDEAALRTRLAADPDDLDARLALGRALAAAARYEEALAELLEVVHRDPRHADDGARKAMLDVFAVVGQRDPLTERYRSDLAKALYR